MLCLSALFIFIIFNFLCKVFNLIIQLVNELLVFWDTLKNLFGGFKASHSLPVMLEPHQDCPLEVLVAT